jgi:hypothetical protein
MWKSLALVCILVALHTVLGLSGCAQVLLELCEHGTLRELLDRRRRLSEPGRQS